MKKIKGIKSSIIAILLVICLGSTVYASDLTTDENIVSISDSYMYPLTSEDEEWKNLTIREKIEACRIPEKVLYDMSDAQLIQAIMDFPFVHEVYLYNEVETGVKALENVSDAYAELISRETGFASLMNYFKQESSNMDNEMTADLELKIEYLAAMIVFQEKFQDYVTIDDMEFITSFSTMIDYNIVEEASPCGAVVPGDGPKTPKGNAVPYTTKTCNHAESDFHASSDQQIVKQYGVTLVSSGTCKYNCHSYAWYSTSTGNPFWIENPAKYMIDGSYTKILTGLASPSYTVGAGCKLYYGNHSAIITSAASNASLGARIVTSKWGTSGVFRHAATNVPSTYDTTNLTVWSR